MMGKMAGQWISVIPTQWSKVIWWWFPFTQNAVWSLARFGSKKMAGSHYSKDHLIPKPGRWVCLHVPSEVYVYPMSEPDIFINMKDMKGSSTSHAQKMWRQKPQSEGESLGCTLIWSCHVPLYLYLSILVGYSNSCTFLSEPQAPAPNINEAHHA